MSWSKVFTAFKGVVAETGEAIADNQALRVLDQEIREAGDELNKAKTELTNIAGKRIGAERKVKDLAAKIAEHENYAGKALDKGDEALARDICERIAEFDTERDTNQNLLTNFSKSESMLKENIRKAEAHLKQLKQQSDVIRATEAVQNAQSAVSSRFSGSNAKMGKALDSLDRIKKRQQERSDRLQADEEVSAMESGDDLNARMREAGITSGATGGDDILARIRAQR